MTKFQIPIRQTLKITINCKKWNQKSLFSKWDRVELESWEKFSIVVNHHLPFAWLIIIWKIIRIIVRCAQFIRQSPSQVMILKNDNSSLFLLLFYFILHSIEMLMFDVVRDARHKIHTVQFNGHSLAWLYFILFFCIFFIRFVFFVIFFVFILRFYNETQQMMCFFFLFLAIFFISRSDSLYISQIVPFSAINKNQEKNPWVWCLMKYYYERLNVLCECVCEFAVQKALWKFTIFFTIYFHEIITAVSRRNEAKGKMYLLKSNSKRDVGKRKLEREKELKKTKN